MDRDRYNRRSVSKDNRGRYRDNSRNRNGSRRRDSPDRSGRRRNSRDRSHDKRDRDRDHRSSAAADDRPAKKVRYDSEVINGKNNENSNGVYAKENQSPTQPSQAEKDDEEELKGLASLYEKDGADDNEDEELDFLIPKKNKEEEEAARLAEERRRRKEEILSKYKKENSDDAVATANADSTNTKPTVENKLKDLAIKDLSNDGVDHKESVGEQYVNEGKQLEAERVAVQREEELQKEKLAFDMFSASPSDLEKAKSGRVALAEALMEGEDPHLQSNWDDGEGYYKARIGELIGDRFRILGIVGKGVFSTVLKCLDVRKSNLAAINGDTASEDQFHVAVKMIRSNDTMRRAAEKEKQILLAITQRDPDDKRHCVKLITHLEYRNHVALVFEYQQMNLRETLKKFGKDVGINIGAVRMYARQLFSALRLLMELRVVHADLKLDNILCSGDLKQVKICDFGSAFFENDTDNDPTPYLVSRFYRAPEIILGLPCKLTL